MLSIIVYGRNDDYGYNLHKRVAISLNCMAEVLTNEDDEIIFVDWNSPGRLPTLIEDISDTLTEKCKDKLKVIKVDNSVHDELAPKDLKRPTMEPYARNAALRNSNPKNGWVLSTNTDIIFSLPDGDLTALVSKLELGYYMAFRYEIPEFLWTGEPRNKPKEFIEKFRVWSSQSTLTRKILLERADYEMPDAPGDFQLAPRDAWFKFNGFPESMRYGWHVDSAVDKLLIEELGFPKILKDEQIRVAHCNHLRNLTHFHQPAGQQNQFDENTKVRKSNDDWGLVGQDKQFIYLEQRKILREEWMSRIANHRKLEPISSKRLIESLEYSLDMCELFIVDIISNLKSGQIVTYLGVNSDFAEKLEQTSKHFGLKFVSSYLYLKSGEINWNELEIEKSGLIILDFGLSDCRKNHATDFRDKVLIGRMAGSVSNLAHHLRQNNKNSVVAAVGPLIWPARTLITSEFATPLFNNYGLVLAGSVRSRSLLEAKSSVTFMMLRSALASEYGVPMQNGLGLVGKAGKRIPKRIKRALRPCVYWLLRATAILR